MCYSLKINYQVNPEIKKALLLNPDKLNTDYFLLNFISVKKEKGLINYVIKPVVSKEIGKHLDSLPPIAQNVLSFFDNIAVATELTLLKNALERPGQRNADILKNNMLRNLHVNLQRLKPYAPAIKWYHRYGDAGKFKVQPCTFSTYRPQLSFKVIKQNNLLALETLVNINGALYPLTDFVQYHYLLRSNNEYFLLLFKDYQTLQWVQALDYAATGNSTASFETEILFRLEKDYKVNRNNLFTAVQIKQEPVNRVYLNELSGSFLMFTPQWRYDDFLVEGKCEEKHTATLNGKTYTIQRNREKEEAFVDLLKSFHPDFPKQINKGYFYVSFAEAQKKQWFLKTYHKLLELDIELTGMDMLRHFKLSPYKAVTTIDITGQTTDQLVLKASVSFGTENIPLNELHKMLLNGQHAVLLKDGSLGVLGEEWHLKYAHIFKHGKIVKDTLTVASWMAVNEQAGSSEEVVLRNTIPDDWWQKWKQWLQPNNFIYELPRQVKATLRPYQQKGYDWMNLLAELGAGACLADDMGLGKTLQTICFITRQAQLHKKIKCLIVCPASLLYNWQNECKNFAPSLTTSVYHGNGRSFECFTNSTQVIISTYGTIRSDIEKIYETGFTVIVLDESHNIKNPSAQTTQAVNRLTALYRIALSGTPVMNNTFDLYAQLNFTLPGLLGAREFFKKEYADAIDIRRDDEKLKALNKLTAPFILRRTKEQVAADLPDKTEIILWCTMGTAQKMQYDEIKDQVRSKLLDNIKKEGLAKSKLFLLQAITRLRQVCNSPLLLPAEEQQCSESVKTEMLMEELQNNLGGHKALVFSQFSSMLDLLAQECNKRELTYYHFDGQTPAAKRAAMVEAFQNPEDKTPVFLISLKAGNTGLNLTAADYVFLVDPWWNTAVQQQAINRTHRIGQTKKVFAYQMICKDSIEEKIIEIQKRKQKLSDELVGEDDGFIKTLSEEDIMYLFS